MLKIILNIIGIVFVCIVGLLRPTKYFNPAKGELHRFSLRSYFTPRRYLNVFDFINI